VNQSFDDPKLKSAVQRVWRQHIAPENLRARVGQLLEESGNSLSIGSNRSSGQNWIGYAIAASVLIFAGLMTWGPYPSGTSPLDRDLPASVAQGMVNRHDLCCGVPDHHALGGSDFALIGRTLSGDLRVPVIATNINGWTFAGAAPCPVWGHETAHLLYRKGNDTMSVFSIPAADFDLKYDDGAYATQIGNHEIAGFLKNGGLYCVVEQSPDGSISAARVQALSDQLHASFGKITYTAPTAAARPSNIPSVASSR
jgi:hypothetical protein